MDIVDVARAGASARWRAVSPTTVVVVGLTAVSAQRHGRARPGCGQVRPEIQALVIVTRRARAPPSPQTTRNAKE